MFLLDPLSALISVIERANQQVKQVQGNKEQCQLLVTRLSHIRNILPQTDAEKAIPNSKAPAANSILKYFIVL